MFVSETSVFPSSKMKITIIGPDGTKYVVAFNPDSTVDQLKVSILGHIISNPSSSIKESLYHKMVLVRSCSALEDEKTLHEQGVVGNDELLLLKRRLCPSQFEKPSDKTKYEDARRGPSVEDIEKATSSMSMAETPKQHTANITTVVDFQTELRKILISLIEVSQKLLCLNPEAAKIFQQAEEILNEPSQNNKVDESDVKQLTEMGFPEHRARKALRENKMSVMSAMEWLLQHGDDEDGEEEEMSSPPPDQENSARSSGADSLSLSHPDEEKGATGGSALDTEANDQTSQCRVSNILQSLRAYKKREFRPNQKTLQHLTEMGFNEADVIDALRATRNDGDAACELLINHRKPVQEDVDEGIEFDSPLFKAIMANPTVQLGLNNPRCLLAFIQMLEHPHTASQWLSDPETAPLLVQVSRIYHAEKHSDMQQKYEEKRSKGKQTSK